MDRKYLIVGNWKANKTPSQSADLVHGILRFGYPKNVTLVVCPPLTSLCRVSDILRGSSIALGAQNMYYAMKGAFTGEVSPLMLEDLDVSYVILGHSERRTIFYENNELIHQKVKAAQAFQLTPILCVGETINERESDRTLAVIGEQISRALDGITDSNLVVAYEPIWAIGTGKTATPEVAQEAHQFIRELLQKQFGEKGQGIHILYGGSMKPDNAASLLEQPDITGGLIGGASLFAESFMDIAAAAAGA
jgi:triosephosphate isomerase